MEAQPIIFDTYQIDEEIEQNKEAILQNSKFIFYKPESNPEMAIDKDNLAPKYIADINSEQIKYKGILSEDLLRVKFGINTYTKNNDKYIGAWNNNVKEGLGVYEFGIQNEKEQQLYFGEWKEGKKKGKGIYLWKHSESAVTDLAACSYDAFLGNFEGDAFTKGILIKKAIIPNEPIDYIIYCGSITPEGKKEDANAILIENDHCFFGQFANDQMVKGNVFIFEQDKETQEEKVKTTYSFEKKEGVDDYKFESKKKNEANDSEKAIKVKANCKKIDYCGFIENLFKEYLSMETIFKELETFKEPEKPELFLMLLDFFKQEGNFNLI